MRQRTLLHALPQPHLCCTLLFSTTTSSRTSPYTSGTSFVIKQKNAQKLSCQKTKPYLCTHKTKTTVLLVKSRQVFPQGEMVEWSITTVLKTVVPRGTGGSNPSLSAKVSATSCETQVALIFRLMVRQICARIFQVIEQTSLIRPILPHQGVFPWNQNQEKFVVHSAAIENRKVLDSRENGEWNVKLGLTLLAITIVLTTQKLLLLSLKVFEEVYFYRG